MYLMTGSKGILELPNQHEKINWTDTKFIKPARKSRDKRIEYNLKNLERKSRELKI